MLIIFGILNKEFILSKTWNLYLSLLRKRCTYQC